MFRLSLTAIALVLSAPAFAFAQSTYPVYSGCATTIEAPGSAGSAGGAPVSYGSSAGSAGGTIVPYGKIWYVDPAKGKTPLGGGLGTAAAPWDSLIGVLGSNWEVPGYTLPGYTRPMLSSTPYYHITKAGRVDIADDVGNPPVQPGDTILLMSGNYGDIGIGGYNLQTTNLNFVTVRAAPGQNPIFTTLYISRTNKWLFDGIKVQSLSGTNKNSNALVTITDQGAAFPTKDIILTNMDISTFDTIPAGFTQAQWIAQGRTGFKEIGAPGNGKNGEPTTSCVALINSHIHNITFGAVLFANNTVFSHNQMDYFGDDGIEYAGNNLAITNNTLLNAFGTSNGIHTDAMQGQVGPIAAGIKVNYFSNILIDSNVIIRQTDPNLAFPQYLQGIDAFDEDWTNMTVTNNVVVTSACWGMYFSSIHNSLIAGNTVLEDGQIPTPGCTVILDVGGVSHESISSSNVRLTNNLANRFVVMSQGDTNIAFDHNVALSNAQSFGGWNPTTNKQYYFSPAGTDANGNVTPDKAIDLTTVFTNWDPSGYKYNLSLKAGSYLFGLGNDIPSVSLNGETRVSPFAPGAY
jgi:hypothetical protein